MRLKRQPDMSAWPVVDGQPTEPYEMPEPPAEETHAKLAEMERIRLLQAERDRTALRRALYNAHKIISARKGKGFEVTLLRRVTIEFHRRFAHGGRVTRCEIYRRGRWSMDLAFWRKPR